MTKIVKATVDETIQDQVRNAPRGKSKSGRQWRTTRNERYSTIRKDKASHSSWATKMALKKELRATKLHEQELKDAKIKEKQDKRTRAEEQQKRRLENEKNSEVVQVIKNTAKIKRMKKKQLRQITKR